VTEILKASQASQLRYVDAANNPADVASRGSSVHVFLNNKTWTSCPAFLLLHKSKWPANLREPEKLEVNDTEVKESIEVNSVQLKEEDDVLSCFIHYFSYWFRLKKVLAWILRFKNLLLSFSEKRKHLRLFLF